MLCEGSVNGPPVPNDESPVDSSSDSGIFRKERDLSAMSL